MMLQKQKPSSQSTFHFLFAELIEECYNIYKENHYIQNLKRIGHDCGFKMYNIITIKKVISQRPANLNILMKIIQQKVFKYLFNYQAANIQTLAGQDDVTNQKSYFYSIEDDISIYLSWMPQQLWDTAVFFAGFIEGILDCVGVQYLSVYCQTKPLAGDKIQTKYFIKISENQYQKWNKDRQ